jgi:hypothetical protein
MNKFMIEKLLLTCTNVSSMPGPSFLDSCSQNAASLDILDNCVACIQKQGCTLLLHLVNVKWRPNTTIRASYHISLKWGSLWLRLLPSYFVVHIRNDVVL